MSELTPDDPAYQRYVDLLAAVGAVALRGTQETLSAPGGKRPAPTGGAAI